MVDLRTPLPRAGAAKPLTAFATPLTGSLERVGAVLLPSRFQEPARHPLTGRRR